MCKKITNIKSILLKDINSCIVFNTQKNQDENFLLDKIASELIKNRTMIAINNINLPDKTLLELTRKIVQLCSYYNSLCVIYKRCDIAKIADLSGVVLSCDDITILDSFKILESDKFFGYLYTKNENISSNFDFILSNDKIANNSNFKNIIIKEG